MKSLFSEFKAILESGISRIEAYVNNKVEVTIDISSGSIKGNEQYRFRDALWKAGILEPANHQEICEIVGDMVGKSFNSNRQLVLALDTSILLLNQVQRYIMQIQKEYQRQFTISRLPLLAVAQATQYELHHMASSERKTKAIFSENFVLPTKMYNLRGQRGKFGAFMLQTLMERYPLVIAKPSFPMIMIKPGDEGEIRDYGNLSPTSPVFDFLIVEQITQLSKISNLEILFLTTDANLSKVANQSGLRSVYLERGRPISSKDSLKMRELLWILVTLLWKHDYITIDGVGYCLTRNTIGKGANLYFKKSDGSRDYYELKVDDRIF